MPARGPAPDQIGRFRADLEALAGAGPVRLGLAVSGGPDSVALLLLAQGARSGEVEAATVDHGLRAESGAEAAFVADLCRGLGIVHAVLKPAAPIEGNLQSAARAARYALLENWRAARGLDWVLTAHHADDQAETVLMRLNRGSGVGGLGGIRAVNGRVLRPLLGWRRTELERIVAAAGISPVTDPSNDDERFDRVRLRRQIRDADWLDPLAFAHSAEAVAEADEALDWAAEQLFAARAVCGGREVRLDPSHLPRELLRRLVLRALRRVAADASPRGEELSRLMARLEQGGTATLAGVRVSNDGDWRFEPAPPRESPSPRARPPSPGKGRID